MAARSLRWIAIAGIGAPGLVALSWFLLLQPSNDRHWQPDVSRLTQATIEGSRVRIANLRNFDYGDAGPIERWEERAYDLDTLLGADLFLSYWGPRMIAHTIMSWEFEGGEHLAISIETRKEVGEEYSAVLGFFRQYELYYVVADERDLVRVRTNRRGEEVYLYPLSISREVARELLQPRSDGPALRLERQHPERPRRHGHRRHALRLSRSEWNVPLLCD